MQPTSTPKLSSSPSRSSSKSPQFRPTLNPTSRPRLSTAPVTRSSLPSTAPTKSTVQAYVCKKTNFAAAVSSSANICSAYKNVLADFTALLPVAGTSANDFTRSNILAKALRLAFHDAGEIYITQTDKLGPDGCLSNTIENAGLNPFGSVTSSSSPSSRSISRADFWVMIGWLSINIASAGGIAVQYQYGRVDAVTCPVPTTRLPSAQLGRRSMNQVFEKQMGLRHGLDSFSHSR